MTKLAENLAANGSFSSPFAVLQTGPTAANPPLYPLFLAFLIKILRGATPVYLVATAGCIIANATTASILPRLSGILYGDVVPGLIASAFWIMAMPIMPSWDISYTVLGLVVFCLVTWKSARGGQRSLKSAFVGGILAALLLLFNPSTLLLIIVPWILLLPWAGEASRRLRVTYGCTVLAIASLSRLPYGARETITV